MNTIQHQMKIYKIVCVICSDGLDKNDKIVAIKCGHIFHEHCLRKWQMQQLITLSCPICRKKYEDVIKVYAEFQCDDYSESSHEIIDQLLQNVTQLESDVSHLHSQLTTKNEKIKKYEIIQRERKTLLSIKESELKNLHAKLKESANVILELNNSVSTLKAKTGIPSAKLNAKNIELSKQNDELIKQMDELEEKLEAKSSELDRCQKAAAQKNKLIKELRESKGKCNEPKHQTYAEDIIMLKAREKQNICKDPDHEDEILFLRAALMDANCVNLYHRFMYHN